MMPSERPQESEQIHLDRRRVLAGGASIGLAAVAGCSKVVNFIGDLALSDLNLLNSTSQKLTGNASVTDPSGSTVHSESFEIDPSSDSSGSVNTTINQNVTVPTQTPGGTPASTNQTGTKEEVQTGSNLKTYGGILSESGSYTVSITVEKGTNAIGVSGKEQSVKITKPDEEHIIVIFAPKGPQKSILIRVIEKLSDLSNVPVNGTTK